jgi:methylglutamate dehydrogenase subunit D
MPETASFAARSAFDGHLRSVGSESSAGVVVRDLMNLQVATVIARRDRDALVALARSAFALDLPAGPKRVSSQSLAFVGTGPRTWIALRDGGSPLAEDLQRAFGDNAAVSDQSDGFAVLRVSGNRVRATFEKGLGIDLHPRAFRPGDSAVTTCAHLGVTLWQLDDAPTYDIAVFRSLASALCHWLAESAAEYGLRVEIDRG